MRELTVDSFAGGGGTSLGITWAIGREPDVALNHDEWALMMHAVNHPRTRHINRNIWQADPLEVTGGQPVGLGWFSPDCKHFSRAKGGKPAKRNIRDLAWVVVLWAKRVRPRVICLENVSEFRDWGPLDADNRPCPERKGQTFEQWVGDLRRLGYKVEWRELRACDYGAPTIRKRFFLVARCDGQPIVWPKPTHGDPASESVRSGRLKPWRTAAEIIDWSLPCPSIFLSKEEGRAVGANRPLAEATMARIAKGVQRYVIDTAAPFIVPLTHHGGFRGHGLDEPLRTVTGANRGEQAIVVPVLTYGQQGGAVRDPTDPMHTITASRKDCNSLVTAFLAQHHGGTWSNPPGRTVDEPVSTLTQTGSHQSVVAARLGKEPEGRAEEVRAFLIRYYGSGGQFADPREPLHTIPTHDRFGLVTVHGALYRIVDIGMRMLTPRELFRAQGFPDSYIIDRSPDGTPLTKTASIRMCGNSVCPQVAEAIARANYAEAEIQTPVRRVRPAAAMPLFEIGDAA